jgi:GH25 family lysozyme M1 (1,4-beta-N-acetylmuramidase)
MQCCIDAPVPPTPVPPGPTVIDVSAAAPASAWACYKTKGITHGIVRAYHSYGAPDANAAASLLAARAAGFSTDVYLFPCFGGTKTAAEQVDEMTAALKAAGADSAYTGIWLDVEANPSTGCQQDANNRTKAENCEFVSELAAAAKATGRPTGIYSSHFEWGKVADLTCTVGSAYPLWYAGYDGVRTCADFKPFAGWTEAAYHQYDFKLNATCSPGGDVSVAC